MLQDDSSEVKRPEFRKPRVVGRIDLSLVNRPKQSNKRRLVREISGYGGVDAQKKMHRLEDDSVERALCAMVREALRGVGARPKDVE